MTPSEKNVAEAFSRLQGTEVLIVGDLLLDHYVAGTVDRISPEAPVPVVHVEQEHYILGGACNVAANVRSLGGRPKLIGVCGRDKDGRKLQSMLRKAEVEAFFVEDKTRPTTRKTRILAKQQQVVRVDYELSVPFLPAVLEGLMAKVRQALPGVKVLVLSDYGKGLISSEFMACLWQEIESLPSPPKIFVDPKVSNFPLYKNVDILTPNTTEAGHGAGILFESKDQGNIIKAGQKIMTDLGCKNLLITLGAAGMALFTGRDTIFHLPTSARKVFDVTGAGDAVIATLALATAAGVSLPVACTLANLAAGLVVAEVGSVAVSAKALQAAIVRRTIPKYKMWL